MNVRYAIVIERGETSYGAYVPDLPGCVAAAETREEAVKLIQEAIEAHIQMLREEGMPVPEPRSTAEYAEVRAA
jgi:predicted RNase H-like HicB family nuclease